MNRTALALTGLALCWLASAAVAAEEPTPAAPEDRPGVATLPGGKVVSDTVLVRVQLVLSRYQGEKKTASIPYTVTAETGGKKAQLRSGVEIPIAMSIGGPDTANRSYQYRTIGTNIDCFVHGSPLPKTYHVDLAIESSSIFSRSEEGSAGKEWRSSSATPMFRSLNVQLPLILRDGQTIQSVAATDPVSGEVVKIEVTLNVVR